VQGDHLVTIFEGKVRLPEGYFAEVPTLPLSYGVGHPVDRHPVSDVIDPSDPTKSRKKINCLTCHQPHASAKPNLLVKDQENNMAFCSSCHNPDVSTKK
jgi:predicted CXXCH cytochrome family protein